MHSVLDGPSRRKQVHRVALGRRKSPHVDQRADLRCLKNRDELGGAARAMAHRGDHLPYAALAALASVFFSVLFSVLFSVFFPAFFFFSSGLPASSVCSPRSISVTSASGALSPLRKPVLRMRR